MHKYILILTLSAFSPNTFACSPMPGEGFDKVGDLLKKAQMVQMDLAMEEAIKKRAWDHITFAPETIKEKRGPCGNSKPYKNLPTSLNRHPEIKRVTASHQDIENLVGLKLDHITHLDLSHNKINYPTGLQAPNLTHLNLSHNELTMKIHMKDPRDWSDFQSNKTFVNLTHLDLSHNKDFELLPPNFADNMPKLQELRLPAKIDRKSIPESLSKRTNIIFVE